MHFARCLRIKAKRLGLETRPSRMVLLSYKNAFHHALRLG